MADDGRTALVSYAKGWDLSSCSALEPLSRSEAEARDRADEPYVMVHRVPGRTVPVEVHLVAWGDHYVGVWAYDERGRRTQELDWRLLEPGRLLLRRRAQWHYDSLDQAEFAKDVWRTRTDLEPDGRGRTVFEPQGALGPSRHGRVEVPEADRRRDRAEFGAGGVGSPLLSEPSLCGRHADDPEATPETSPADGAAAALSPWLPPRPAAPPHLSELFRPGTRVATKDQPEMTVNAVREIAVLRVPSGRLAVACPLTTDDGRQRELRERIPPGAYPLQEAILSYELEYAGEVFPVEEGAAVRLLIDEEPAATWELALAEGEDARLLRDDEAYGFPTDAALGSFADSAAWSVLADKYRRYSMEGEEDAGEPVSDSSYVRTSDSATGGDLIHFPTGGDGVWPVWLGRSAAGKPVAIAVACVYLPDLRILGAV
ncbi:DUF4241 domain-containing protein [Streptomyces sp. NPDC046942]|uniref:DUF4241 domain-containing protein n=1 Tax=Streptomyces sp. NPDC046942 TaxID=3155137 RepID=UPI0033C686A5